MVEKDVIGETLKPIKFCTMANRIGNEWLAITNVREMGAYKALLTFEAKEDIEATMKDGIDFEEVRPWCEQEWRQIRKTQIECYGVPLHAWLKELAEV